jgi:hypothetical protein
MTNNNAATVFEESKRWEDAVNQWLMIGGYLHSAIEAVEFQVLKSGRKTLSDYG